MGYAARGNSAKTSVSSGGLHMSVRLAFVAMKSGSDKLNAAFLQIFVRF